MNNTISKFYNLLRDGRRKFKQKASFLIPRIYVSF